MATITTTGDVSDILSLTQSQLEGFSSTVTSYFQNLYYELYDFSYDLYYRNFSVLYRSDTYLSARSTGYNSGETFGVAGTGFTGTSGSITSIECDGSSLNWRITGRASWSASKGVTSGSFSSFEMWNEQNTTHLTVEGKLTASASSMSGTLSSMTTTINGITIVEKGSFKIGDVEGSKYSSLEIQDAGGNKVVVSAKITVAEFNALADSLSTLGDLFDSTELLKGNDTLTATDNSRAWHGYGGNDVLNGGALADVLTGDDGNDKLSGFDGADDLDGGAGNDQLTGGDGADTISGGAGVDKISGGLGADRFVFDVNTAASFADTISDFRSAEGDKIVLTKSAFTALASLDSVSGSLLSAAKVKALEADDYLLFDTKSGKLSYDADGSGAGKAVLLATLTGVTSLSESDFLLA